MNFILSVLLGSIISLVSYHLRLLSLKGAIATFVLAVIIFTLGSWKWTIPILSFFIFSSLLSKIRKKMNPGVNSVFQRGDERDHIQVIANGGFPGMIILINQIHTTELFYIAYVSAVAAACSDTWATEIGTLINTKTFNIINFNPVEQGISGGVSLLGFIGAILGAIIITVSAVSWLNISYGLFFIILASGVFASVFDSILGSTYQVKYTCMVCDKTIENKFHCGKNTVHAKGVKWLDNDAVNFAASSFGGLMPLAITSLIL